MAPALIALFTLRPAVFVVVFMVALSSFSSLGCFS
jgi:hypothetical protein